MAKAKSPTAKAPPPAEYTVVARRYRPQQFSDLIGQEHVANALVNALQSGRVAHAYLFTGARGVGKTSCARILAKALNCVKGPTATPCDECEICKSVAVGEDLDVLEIDGASNNKVEEIRDLRSNVGFRPARARYKIYIIDEVHMLTTAAFNALLKTLEEPPPHVKFIFATTEAQKIPITILSRCQRFDFAHVSTNRIFAALKAVVAKEGLKADDEALHLIARRAAGSMRDSQSLLDQLMAFSDGHLTAEKAHSIFGTASDDRVLKLVEAILNGDARVALEEIHDAAARGMQLGELLDQMIEYWRGLMLIQSAGPEFSELDVTPAVLEAMRGHAKRMNLDTILAGIDVLATTRQKMRGSSLGQVLIELAVVRLARLEELLSIGGLVAALNGAPGGVKLTSAPADASKKKSLTADREAPAAESGETSLPQLWSQLIEKLGPIRGSQLQQAGMPAILGPNSLAIRVPSTYTSAYESLATEATIDAIRNHLSKLSGQTWSIRVEKSQDHAVQDVAIERPRAVESGVMRTKDVMELPMFKSLSESLGAQIVKIDPGFNPSAVAVVAAELTTTTLESPPEDEEP